jgi:hypothetical protein
MRRRSVLAVIMFLVVLLVGGCTFMVSVADDGSTNNLNVTNTPGPLTVGVTHIPALTTQPAVEGAKP